GATALGGMGGVSLVSQLLGTALGITVALVGGFAVYGAIRFFIGLRLDAEEEFNGADLSIHKIASTPNLAAGQDE
ncbi:MAG: ammonium transporter, partial [Methylobacillus glycogenes]|nr:ammonium transporter [Methylobacillus glycogenes]